MCWHGPIGRTPDMPCMQHPPQHALFMLCAPAGLGPVLLAMPVGTTCSTGPELAGADAACSTVLGQLEGSTACADPRICIACGAVWPEESTCHVSQTVTALAGLGPHYT